MIRIRFAWFAGVPRFSRLLLVVVLGISPASPEDSLDSILRATRWISFAPTAYNPYRSPAILPSDNSLRLDLTTVHAAGFDGLITYGASLRTLPRIAEAVGFAHIIVGVWDPFNSAELDAALDAVRDHNRLVSALIIGNEGLLNGRYTVPDLCAVMKRVEAITGKPVSSTEPVDWIISEPQLAQCSSFITVNAHPFFSNQKSPRAAVRWTIEAWEAVRELYPGKPVLFKEVGLPSSGDPSLSELTQKQYYEELAKTPVVFSYFEAFDAPWKDGLIEQSWGLWRSDRQPKLIINFLPWRRSVQ